MTKYITVKLTEDQLREIEVGIRKLMQLSELIPLERNPWKREAETQEKYRKAEIKLAYRKRLLTALAKAKS